MFLNFNVNLPANHIVLPIVTDFLQIIIGSVEINFIIYIMKLLSTLIY